MQNDDDDENKDDGNIRIIEVDENGDTQTAEKEIKTDRLYNPFTT